MNTPPKDLAGYQNIITGTVMPDDIIVDGPTRVKFFACHGNGIPFVGMPIESVFGDVYRKMDVPRHDGETKWQRLPMPDGQNFYIPKVDDPAAAKTDDSGKPPLANLPWKALRKVSKVQAYGHKKYGDFYNYKKGMEVTRQLGCAVRHIADYLDGIDLDKESGESHLAHAACRILFALENEADGKLIDDRFNPDKK